METSKTLLLACGFAICLIVIGSSVVRADDCRGPDDCKAAPGNISGAAAIAAAAAGAAMALEKARHRQKNNADFETDLLQPLLSSPGVHIRSHKDIGTQHVEPDTLILPQSEIRLRSVFDQGEQQIQAETALLTNQRWDDE